MNKSVLYKNSKVSFSVLGKGSVVVLLHGFLEDSSMWRTVINEIVKKHKVICVDLLGHGNTGCIGYIHTMEEMAEAVKVVLKEEGVRKATFIGHSMGGYVALAFAEKYLKNVKGLCLMHSSAQGDTAQRKELRLRAVKVAKKNYKGLIVMSVNNLFLNEKRKDILKEIKTVEKIALQTPLQGYIACTEGMRIRKNREDVLKGLLVKKIIVLGSQDPILGYTSIKKEAERTGTKLIELSSGHMSHIETSKEFLKAILSFLKEK